MFNLGFWRKSILVKTVTVRANIQVIGHVLQISKRYNKYKSATNKPPVLTLGPYSDIVLLSALKPNTTATKHLDN